MIGLVAASVIAAALLGFGLLSEDAAYDFSEIVYFVIPAASGLALMAAALTLNGREKVAWFVIGAGALSWGLGEIIWVVYEFFLQVEVPYPGWADVFYVLGYPLIFAGVLLLPHVKPRPMERLRLALDTVAGSIALTAIVWVTYLGGQIYLDPDAGFLEQIINLLYPFGDLFLLIALMILTVRRSSLRFDLRLIVLGLGMIVNVVADVVYVFQVEADTYASGGWLDAVWLIAYAAFIVVALLLLHPVEEREQVERTSRLWQMVAPYSAIVTLFGMTLVERSGSASLLEMASGVVGLLIIVRQGVAIRENRELVEKQRDDLISSISHELRTPLTSIQGFAQMLREQGEQLAPEQRTELVEIIERQGRHLGGVVSDLVDVARDRLSGTRLDVETLDLLEVITDARTMLQEPGTAAVDVTVHVRPGILLSGDRRRMTQVIVNLLSNAIRYGHGRIEIDAHVGRGQVDFEVHDDGPGVPRRYQERIWERFERGAHRLDAVVPGSGIGLSVVRSLVKAHGGRIEYRTSERLGGACFAVSLPSLSSADGAAEPITTPA